MSKFPLTASLVALLTVASAFAQREPPPKEAAASPCPQITIANAYANSNTIVRDGQQVSFAVTLSGGDQAVTPTYVWSTSAGVIVNGQGTRSVTIDSTGAGDVRELRAELWVSGYSGECQTQASVTIRVAGPARKIAEFGELPPEKEDEQIDMLIAALSGTTDNGYVFGYAGRTSPRGYTMPVLKRIKARLLAANIPPERLGIMDAGFREQPSFEVWIAPLGADAPKATPTIKAKDIVYPKTTPAKKT